MQHIETILTALYDYKKWWADGDSCDKENLEKTKKAIEYVEGKRDQCET